MTGHQRVNRVRCIFGHDWRRVTFSGLAVIPTTSMTGHYMSSDKGEATICRRCGKLATR